MYFTANLGATIIHVCNEQKRADYNTLWDKRCVFLRMMKGSSMEEQIFWDRNTELTWQKYTYQVINCQGVWILILNLSCIWWFKCRIIPFTEALFVLPFHIKLEEKIECHSLKQYKKYILFNLIYKILVSRFFVSNFLLNGWTDTYEIWYVCSVLCSTRIPPPECFLNSIAEFKSQSEHYFAIYDILISK